MLNDTTDEWLVVFEKGLPSNPIEKLKKVVRVTQMLPPRLVLICANKKMQEQVNQITGVLGIYKHIPPELAVELTFQEQIFVSAWISRQLSKERRGDKLPWDSQGFAPPDIVKDGESNSLDR